MPPSPRTRVRRCCSSPSACRSPACSTCTPSAISASDWPGPDVPFLELDDVHKHFGTNHVLRGIDLTVERHEVVFLIGASGCGKSTMLRCVNALERIDQGRIVLDGYRIS